ncbi:MAG: hypothetical protein LCH37_05285 [Bacteroidetes bacterium]|nr:hypothetical protein [Bacteroidota bacterium]
MKLAVDLYNFSGSEIFLWGLNKVWYHLFILFGCSIFKAIAIIAKASLLFLAVFSFLEELGLLFADIEHSFACSHCICKKNQVFGAGWVFANFGGALALKLWIRIILLWTSSKPTKLAFLSV